MKTKLGGSSKNQGRAIKVFLSTIIMGTLSAFLFVSAPTIASAAPPIAVNQCNDSVPNNVGGRGVHCDVTVTNNLNLATGSTDSVVTTRICDGFANAPLTCTEATEIYADALVSSVTQCNANTNGGGAELECHITVLNNVIGEATENTPTVNQCNNSGDGGGTEPVMACDPSPAITTDADITQCNYSGNNGGGGGLGAERIKCEVGPSKLSSAIPFKINQCNYSSNNGGSTVICDVNMTTTTIPVTPPPTTTPPTDNPTPPTTTPPSGDTPGTPPGGGTPGTPDNPGTPGTPDNPGTPGTPDNPGTPGTPDNPGTPGTPDSPRGPGSPPEGGTPPDITLASTGVEAGPAQAGVIGAGSLVLLGAGLIIFMKLRASKRVAS